MPSCTIYLSIKVHFMQNKLYFWILNQETKCLPSNSYWTSDIYTSQKLHTSLLLPLRFQSSLNEGYLHTPHETFAFLQLTTFNIPTTYTHNECTGCIYLRMSYILNRLDMLHLSWLFWYIFVGNETPGTTSDPHSILRVWIFHVRLSASCFPPGEWSSSFNRVGSYHPQKWVNGVFPK